MILECMRKCFVLVLFLHSLLLMMATNCLLVVITITIIIVEEKSGDVHLVVRKAMGKVMTVSACNVLTRTSVVTSYAGRSSESGGSVTMDIYVLLGCGIGLFSLISGS